MLRYPTEFRWELLVDDDESATGPARFDSQFWRANVDPSERYVLSLPGTSQYRLAPDETGYENLVFAGDWTRCGLNSGCVEAAVISGLWRPPPSTAPIPGGRSSAAATTRRAMSSENPPSIRSRRPRPPSARRSSARAFAAARPQRTTRTRHRAGRHRRRQRRRLHARRTSPGRWRAIALRAAIGIGEQVVHAARQLESAVGRRAGRRIGIEPHTDDTARCEPAVLRLQSVSPGAAASKRFDVRNDSLDTIDAMSPAVRRPLRARRRAHPRRERPVRAPDGRRRRRAERRRSSAR